MANCQPHQQKAFWSWISKLRACRSPIPPLLYNDNVITSDSDKAAIFNDCFVSVFTKERTINPEELQHHLPNKAFHLDSITVSPSEVFEELSTLNPHKVCGPDQICPHLLKEGGEIVALLLAELFNKSLSDGVLLLHWVSAIVILFLRREINTRHQIIVLLALLVFYARSLKRSSPTVIYLT